MSLEKSGLTDFELLFGSLGIESEQVFNKYIAGKIRSLWPQIIGPMFLNHTEVTDFNSGNLIITVSHSSYKQEILFNLKQIQKDLNENLKNKPVKTILVKTGQIKKYLNTDKLIYKNSEQKQALNSNISSEARIYHKIQEMIQAIMKDE